MLSQALKDIVSERIIRQYKLLGTTAFTKREFIENMFLDDVYIIPEEYEIEYDFMMLAAKRIVMLRFINRPFSTCPVRHRVFEDTSWNSPEWDNVITDYIVETIKYSMSYRRDMGEFWISCWTDTWYFIRGGDTDRKYDLIKWIKQEFPCRTEKQIDDIMTCIFPPPYPDPHECIEDRVFCN